MRKLAGIASLVVLLLGAVPGLAQQQPAGPAQSQLRSPVLTIDADRLFAETLFGARVRAEVTAAADALAAENRSIEAMLKDEVDRLTEGRATMDVETFRAEADAFDARVQAIRQEQDAKEADLTQALTDGREAFLAAATPVLGQLMIDNGAVVILDRRTVFLGVGLVDITDAAIATINATLGDGSAAPQEVPAQE